MTGDNVCAVSLYKAVLSTIHTSITHIDGTMTFHSNYQTHYYVSLCLVVFFPLKNFDGFSHFVSHIFPTFTFTFTAKPFCFTFFDVPFQQHVKPEPTCKVLPIFDDLEMKFFMNY